VTVTTRVWRGACSGARNRAELEEVSKEQEVQTEIRKRQRVADGRPEDDSAGDKSSEDKSSEGSQEQSSDVSSDYKIWHHTDRDEAENDEDTDLCCLNKDTPDESFGADETASAGAANDSA